MRKSEPPLADLEKKKEEGKLCSPSTALRFDALELGW